MGKLREDKIQQERDRLVLLNSLLSLSLEDIPINTLLQKALELIIKLSWIAIESRGIVFLIEDDTGLLAMKAQKGITEEMQKSCASLPQGKCLCGKAALTKEIQFSSFVDERHEIRYEGIYPHGHYCVPILYLGKALGVLNIYIPEGHAYDPREEEFLQAVTNTLAGVIERRNAQERERKAKEFIEVVFDNMHDATSVIDVNDFKIIDANKVFLDLVARKKEEVIGRHCYEITHRRSEPCLPPEDICPITDILKTGAPATVEHIHYNSEGKKVYVEITASPIKNNRGEVIQVVHSARNITYRKEAEQKLQEAYQELKNTQEQLIQSSKMAAIGQLAAGISHELNQPLTGIKGFAQVVLMDLKDDGQLKDDLNKIVEQTERMDKIIKNIRFFARKSEFKIEELDINQPLEDSLMLLSEQLKVHNIRLKVYLDKDLPKIKGDANQLQQVFLNLITNARDAIDSQKSLEAGEILVKSVLSQDKNNIEIIFEDTGCGISPENLGSIFNPFFTTKSPDKGMGLGLSIAYRIIENHHGKIEVKSQLGKGAAFKIALPVDYKDEKEVTGLAV